MNPSDFTFFVLPLGILVFVLVAGILLILKKEEIAKDKKIRRIDAYLKEKGKDRKVAEGQVQELNVMLESKSIDKETFKRLKTIVEMHQESEAETGDVLKKIWEE
jgi:hypothetical protein